MSESTGDTRSRIQEVALELFTEQGYERTSLREIAERLGVTKAALYYHFKSKDDIVNSFVQDRIDRIDELVARAQERPRDAANRRDLIEEYADEIFGGHSHRVMHFFEQNQTVLKSLTAGQMMRDRMTQLADVLAGGDASPTNQLRAILALFAVHTSWFALRGPNVDEQERRSAALAVAFELLDRNASGAEAG
ncbi:TetR/AcrR family transcriptional regulator [Plantactinospora sp. KBS50]|uniref:TetR/AcrR family transcriptional regulator n=1 Tax=Plantactinospora sp. KBS50 TaxID=2024580 RepID=UPI000BAAA6A4|nr:TetR/AcrR family transcriptional regulator [Plantactinospora sp. KBS50]ASW56577.1 TetR family transcriptional regulator [Plantactinospora sp. KBS50]